MRGVFSYPSFVALFPEKHLQATLPCAATGYLQFVASLIQAVLVLSAWLSAEGR